MASALRLLECVKLTAVDDDRHAGTKIGVGALGLARTSKGAQVVARRLTRCTPGGISAARIDPIDRKIHVGAERRYIGLQNGADSDIFQFILTNVKDRPAVGQIGHQHNGKPAGTTSPACITTRVTSPEAGVRTSASPASDEASATPPAA